MSLVKAEQFELTFIMMKRIQIIFIQIDNHELRGKNSNDILQ